MKGITPAVLEREWSPVDLAVFQGSPFSETVTVPGRSWGGDYIATARLRRDETDTTVATLTVSAAEVDPDTVFQIDLSKNDSDLVPPGTYAWDARNQDGTIRLSGRFVVRRTATP